MAVHLKIRDLPDKLHRILRRRAAARGLSLREYVLGVLREHCEQPEQPAVDEWLDGLSRLTPGSHSTPAAKAVQEAREEEEAALVNVRARP